MSFCYAYYSDDEGETWQRSRNEVHASIEGGMGGAFSMGEAQIVELVDGRLLLMAWSPSEGCFDPIPTTRVNRGKPPYPPIYPCG